MSTDPNLNDNDYELLSAYIDGILSDSDLSALELRLRQEPLLQRELNALRQTVSLINQLPVLKAPRNFTLTPEMLGIRTVEKPRRPLIFPVLQAVSAVAAMIMIVFAVTMLVTEGTGQFTSSDQANEADVAFMSTLTQEAGVAFMNTGELTTAERLTAVFLGTEVAQQSRLATPQSTMRIPNQFTLLTLTAQAEMDNVQLFDGDTNDDAELAPMDSTGMGELAIVSPETDLADEGGNTNTLAQTAPLPNTLVLSPIPSMTIPALGGGSDSVTTDNFDYSDADDSAMVEPMMNDEVASSPTFVPIQPSPGAVMIAGTRTPTRTTTPAPTMTTTPSATLLPPTSVAQMEGTPVAPPVPNAAEQEEAMEAESAGDESQAIQAIVEATEDEATTITEEREVDNENDLLPIGLLVVGIGLLIIVFLSWWLPRRKTM